MTHLSTLCHRLAQAFLTLGAALATTAALAVNSLPGGPAVDQLDLHPPVTKIAADQRWLHYYMMVICVVIFIAVFGVMFYSIFKHRKSLGAKAANFHESVAVEIAWTVVPFLIVIGMALPATKVVVAMKDTTNADLTIKATGYQWKWGYDYMKGEGEGIAFLSTLDPKHREMSDSGHPPATDDYLLKVDNPLVVPVDQQDPHHHDRQRRDPRVHGAGLRHQAGRDAGLRPRHLVPGPGDRRLLRPVRRAVRQGTRLHADPRQGAEPGRLREVGRGQEEGHGRAGR